jgi:hypothetical protein
MSYRFLLLAGLLVGVFCGATGQEEAKKLPIDLPKDAKVNFDVDAPARELVPFIGMLLSKESFDPTAGTSRSIPFQTPFGTINIATKDLQTLLEPVRELHVISFDGDGKDHAIAHYQQEFSERGMRRIANIIPSDSLLIMKSKLDDGKYLAVLEQGKHVTVVRTDGMPDLGTLGQFALEKLTQSANHLKGALKF